MSASTGSGAPLRSWREENKTAFADTVAAAAGQLDIQPLAVAKDYWVCQALRGLVSTFPGQIVFKGGTSLEKLRLIQRFSEDLDLLVVGEYGTARAAKKVLRAMCACAAEHVGATSEDGLSGGSLGSLHRQVWLTLDLGGAPSAQPGPRAGSTGIAEPARLLVELGQSGGKHPVTRNHVIGLLADRLQQAGVGIDGFVDLAPFEVDILHPGRTLLEKLLRVNNFSARRDLRDDTHGWPRIGRQFYDIWA